MQGVIVGLAKGISPTMQNSSTGAYGVAVECTRMGSRNRRKLGFDDLKLPDVVYCRDRETSDITVALMPLATRLRREVIGNAAILRRDNKVGEARGVCSGSTVPLAVPASRLPEHGGEPTSASGAGWPAVRLSRLSSDATRVRAQKA